MVQVFQGLSIACLVLGVVFLVTSVILFLALDVVALLGELSGKNAAKQVQVIREQSKKAAVARQIFEGGALRERSGALQKTDKIETVEATVPLSMTWQQKSVEDEEPTTVLTDEEATTVLSDIQILDNVAGIHTEEVIDI